MNRFNKFLVASLMTAAMFLTSVAQTMEMRQYDKMADQDQAEYVGLLVQGIEKVLTDKGRDDLAAQVDKLFITIPAGDKMSLDMTELERNLALARVADAERAAQDPNAQPPRSTHGGQRSESSDQIIRLKAAPQALAYRFGRAREMAEIRSTVTHESAEPPDELEVARQIAFILDRGRRLLAERRAREPVGIEDKLPPAVSTRATPATTSTKADGNLEVGQLGPGGRFIVSPRGSETAVSFFTKRDHAVAFAEAHGGLAPSQPPAWR